MKRRKFIFVSVILIIIYLPFAPVFIKSEYGTQIKAPLPVAESYSYLWIHTQDSFLYCLLCSFSNIQFQKTTTIFFRDENKLLDKLRLSHALLIIDGVNYEAKCLEASTIKMDAGSFNMYGGNGASGNLEFDLPSIPKNSLKVIIKGDAIDINGKRLPFEITLKSKVVTDLMVAPLFIYVYGNLFYST